MRKTLIITLLGMGILPGCKSPTATREYVYANLTFAHGFHNDSAVVVLDGSIFSRVYARDFDDTTAENFPASSIPVNCVGMCLDVTPGFHRLRLELPLKLVAGDTAYSDSKDSIANLYAYYDSSSAKIYFQITYVFGYQ